MNEKPTFKEISTYILMFIVCIGGCLFLANAFCKFIDTWTVKDIEYVCIDKQTTSNRKGGLGFVLIVQRVNDKQEVFKDYVTTNKFYNTEIGDIVYHYEDVPGHMTHDAWKNIIYAGISFLILIILGIKMNINNHGNK